MQPSEWADELELLHSTRKVDNLGLVKNREGVMRERGPAISAAASPARPKAVLAIGTSKTLGMVKHITMAAGLKIRPPAFERSTHKTAIGSLLFPDCVLGRNVMAGCAGLIKKRSAASTISWPGIEWWHRPPEHG